MSQLVPRKATTWFSTMVECATRDSKARALSDHPQRLFGALSIGLEYGACIEGLKVAVKVVEGISGTGYLGI